MKKFTLIALLAIVMMAGCMSKNEKLCESKWILSQRIINNTGCDTCKLNMIFYKKSGNEFSLKFEKEGIVHITEHGLGYDYTWELEKDNKTLKIFVGGEYFTWTIADISSNELSIYYTQKDESFVNDTYYTLNNKDWFTDEMVDAMNKTDNKK